MTDTPTDKRAATPIPAATILLLRDGSAGLEVFMVLRHHQIDFASGALVFPGGKVDPQDTDPGVLARLAAYPNATPTQSQLRAAAIREAFEESGILLARPVGNAGFAAAGAHVDAWRHGLNAQSLTLSDVLALGDLQLACDALLHFAQWITPPIMPKRFDTHFYLARVPAEQVAAHDGHENIDSVWITPQQAVADAQAGSRTIIFPTLANLIRLAQYASVDDALAGAAAMPVVPVLPWTEQRADGNTLCIRTDAGYSFTEQKFQGARP